MNSARAIYVGIDLLPSGLRSAAGQRKRTGREAARGQETFLDQLEGRLSRGSRSGDEFTYAALDPDLRLLAIGRGSQADLLAYLGGQPSALVAINAPRRPGIGLMRQDSVRQALDPPPRPGSWLKYRVAEYQLRFPLLPTPEDIDACPAWMRCGFELYRQLESLGFAEYPGNDEMSSAEQPRQLLEVHAFASFSRLLGLAPFPADTLEGRLQRQLILHELGVRVADPMAFFEEVTPRRLLHGVLPLKNVLTPVELDALVAAYTAYLAAQRPQQVSLLGAPEEGQIVVPLPAQPQGQA